MESSVLVSETDLLIYNIEKGTEFMGEIEDIPKDELYF